MIFLRSHISIRSQCVSLCNVQSHEESVPQGSVLGLIHFNLYINNFVNVSNKFQYVLFANDTNILFSCETINNVEDLLNIELNKWLCTNKLSINLSIIYFNPLAPAPSIAVI